MNERSRKWAASDDPEWMLACVNPLPAQLYGFPVVVEGERGYEISERKARLWACAVWNEVWSKVERQSRRSDLRRAIIAGKQMADGCAPPVGLLSHYRVTTDSGIDAAWTTARDGEVVHSIGLEKQCSLLREIIGDPFAPVSVKRKCVRCAGEGKYKAIASETLFGSRTDAPVELYCSACLGQGWTWPAWRTPRVVEAARAIYEDGAFHLLPVLSDDLEEDGCDNESLLMHLRGKERCLGCGGSGSLDNDYAPGKITCRACKFWGSGLIDLRSHHVKGCWALDLLLGKE